MPVVAGDQSDDLASEEEEVEEKEMGWTVEDEDDVLVDLI